MKSPRIALGKANQKPLIAQVAEALKRGELCILPTETVYGIATLPNNALALERICALKGRALEKNFTLHLADRSEAETLASCSDLRVQRLMTRYWPGPLTLVLPAHGGGNIGVRLPAHDFTRAVIRATGPLCLTSANRSGEQPLCDPAIIDQQFGSALQILIDDGPSPLGNASTVVRCIGAELEVLREGILSRHEILHAAAAKIVFVCTGNTCRSPMAAALARRALATTLGIGANDLIARGIEFSSMGTGTIDDLPASEGSTLAMHEQGIDLLPHRSRTATQDLLQRADHVYCLAASHLRAVHTLLPGIGNKATLLAKDQQDIEDPYGGSLVDYRLARDAISAAIHPHLTAWLQLLPKAALTQKRP
ncbi:MAG: threonylcarbamoyl-AMP synthase [Planctomycetes bacterium]|nr:threonylcarbamoyl-AMP synthase [Planctomycetota bacterium]